MTDWKFVMVLVVLVLICIGILVLIYQDEKMTVKSDNTTITVEELVDPVNIGQRNEDMNAHKTKVTEV